MCANEQFISSSFCPYTSTHSATTTTNGQQTKVSFEILAAQPFISYITLWIGGPNSNKCIAFFFQPSTCFWVGDINMKGGRKKAMMV